MVANSLDKGNKLNAFDHILGGNHLVQYWYGCGQNVHQIKLNNLKLFELVVLAQVVHNFEPQYLFFDTNLYWYCNMLADAVVEIFDVDKSINPGDAERERKYAWMTIDPHTSDISG